MHIADVVSAICSLAQNFCRYSNEKIGVPLLPQCSYNMWVNIGHYVHLLASAQCTVVPTWRLWRRRRERWWRWWAPWRPGWPGWAGSCGRLANFNREIISQNLKRLQTSISSPWLGPMVLHLVGQEWYLSTIILAIRRHPCQRPLNPLRPPWWCKIFFPLWSLKFI